MDAIVELESVSKDYHLGKVVVPAVRDVSLTVRRGDFLAIAGPSGSGKTTLLNLIGCVDVPSAGTVRVAGQDTSRLSERALTDLRLHQIGFIFQSFNLVAVLDVFQNVELPLLLQRGTRARERRTRVMDLLEKVGLQDHLRHRPTELSGGQRQRVAVARALVSRPKLVLADEPTANLDSATGGTIIDLMRELNRNEGTTFLFSTHDAKVMTHATGLVRLQDGRIDPEPGPLPPVTAAAAHLAAVAAPGA
ncbi:MAG: ABC transporter ATP-binding protein [Myxococcota bacterium]|jgi:putative ABC transport system ATP-binding protein|nr:ABC transporter ATP-binding protein [Myxococcota bacterium]